MTVGLLILIAAVGSAIWVFIDAPRHGLSRGWSVGCLLLWAVFFPWYLMERATEGRPEEPYSVDRPHRIKQWLRDPHILGHRRAALAVLIVGVPLTLFGIWELRLLYRPLFMLLVIRHPALVSIPLLAALAGFVVHLVVRHARRALRGYLLKRNPRRAGPRSRKRGVRVSAPPPEGRRRYLRVDFSGDRRRAPGHGPPPFLHGPRLTALVCAVLGFVFASIVTSAWTGRAIYEHTDYERLTMRMLSGGKARLKPYEVAERQSQNGLNSPTEHPTNLHIVKVGGELLWTSVRDPGGLFRVLFKPTRGVMSVDAGSTAPRVTQSGPRYDADFRYGPGMQISENIRWQVYKKRCYTCDVAEMTGVPTANGPLVIAPYIRYSGNWFVRRPEFGGVYLVHPGGRIEDLSPEEAARSPVVRESGRLFPEKLARRIADAYKFKRGVWNRLFVHSDQLEVADTDENRQPFLQDFEGLGPQWVTTLKPRGRTFTTAGIMTSDAVTGQTRVWLSGRGRSLIGNQRALDIVRGESFPGIDFADPRGPGGGGKFRVVEPRQVFPGGRLHFLLSIIPDAANRITMSVVVDAESQRVTAKFPASPEGDEDLIAYLRTGEVQDAESEADPEPGDEHESGADAGPDEDTGARATLRRLLRENRAEQRRAAGRISDLEAQERDLRRLLRAAERER